MCGLPSGKDSACQCSRCKRLRFDPWVRKIPLKEEVATHSSFLAWRIPWTEEPGGLQSMGVQAVKHDRARTHGVAYQQRLCANPNLSVHPICSLPPWYPKGFKCRLHFNPCIPVAACLPLVTTTHVCTHSTPHIQSPPFAAADTSAVPRLPSSAQLALASCSQSALPFEEIPSGSKIAADFCDMGEETELLPRVCLVVLMLSAVTHAAADHHINRLLRNYHLG